MALSYTVLAERSVGKGRGKGEKETKEGDKEGRGKKGKKVTREGREMGRSRERGASKCCSGGA